MDLFERDLLPPKRIKFILVSISLYMVGFCIKTYNRDYINEARRNMIKRDLAKVK